MRVLKFKHGDPESNYISAFYLITDKDDSEIKRLSKRCIYLNFTNYIIDDVNLYNYSCFSDITWFKASNYDNFTVLNINQIIDLIDLVNYSYSYVANFKDDCYVLNALLNSVLYDNCKY